MTLFVDRAGLRHLLLLEKRKSPAVVREVSEEDAHIMSLVENIARRNGNALELLQSIKYLKSQGYEDDAIAAKTNLGKDYIRGIIRLLEAGRGILGQRSGKGTNPFISGAEHSFGR